MPVKVYYLDDEIDLLSVFIDTFESSNVQVSTFDDPEKAIHAVNTTPPDIFFIDYRLPNMTGIVVALRIQVDIPIVLITADSNVANDPQTKILVKAIFAKPFQLQKWKNSLRRIQTKFNYEIFF